MRRLIARRYNDLLFQTGFDPDTGDPMGELQTEEGELYRDVHILAVIGRGYWDVVANPESAPNE